MMMTTGTLSTVALLSEHDDDNNADDSIPLGFDIV